MWWFRALTLALVLATVSGCGFRPLYATRTGGGSAAADLQTVAIGSIPDRLGQILRNNLLDRITPRGQPDRPRYRLEIQLIRTQVGLAIKKDLEITRSNLKLIAVYALSDLKSGVTVLQDQARSTASFNLVSSDFANLSAGQDAERRVAREISDQITTRLAVFFNRRRAG